MEHKEIEQVHDGEIVDGGTASELEIRTVEPFTEEEARQFVRDVRARDLYQFESVILAYFRRAWEPLGYANWDEFWNAEIGPFVRFKLPRGARRETVHMLATRAMLSNNAIATVLRVDNKTVGTDIRALRSQGVEIPDERFGLDGKRYADNRPQLNAPTVEDALLAIDPTADDEVQARIAKANAAAQVMGATVDEDGTLSVTLPATEEEAVEVLEKLDDIYGEDDEPEAEVLEPESDDEPEDDSDETVDVGEIRPSTEPEAEKPKREPKTEKDWLDTVLTRVRVLVEAEKGKEGPLFRLHEADPSVIRTAAHDLGVDPHEANSPIIGQLGDAIDMLTYVRDALDYRTED